MKDEPAIVRQLRDEEKLRVAYGSTETIFKEENSSQPSLETTEETLNESTEALLQTLESKDNTNEEQLSLHEPDEMFKTIFHNVNDVIAYVDRHGKFILVNNRVKDVFGYDPSELIGKNVLRTGIFKLTAIPLMIKLFRDIAVRGEVIDNTGKHINIMELEIKRKDGSIALVEASTTVLRRDGKQQGFVSILRDITERKQNEHLVKKTEEKFRQLTQLLPESIFEMTLDGRITFVNTTGLHLFGFSQQDIENGVTAFQIVIPEQHDILKKGIAETIINPIETKPFEYTVVTKSGRRFPAFINTNIIFDEQKRPVGLRGILVDISERKKEEDILKKSEVRFRELAELLPESVFEMTLDGLFTYVNTAAITLSGYSQEEVMHGLNALQMIVPADHQRVKENLGKIIQGILTGPNEYTAVKKNGELFSVLINTNVIFDANEKPIGFRGIITDITERKDIEEQIKLSEEKFRALAENSLDVIMRFDRNLRHLYVNSRVTSQTGMKPDQMIGKTHAELGFPQTLISQWEPAIQQVFDTGTGNRIEFQLPNGTWIDWLLSPEFSPDGNVKAVLASARDITERKKAEEAIKESEKRYRLLVDNTEFPVVVTSISDGRILFYNQRAKIFFGVPSDDASNVQARDFWVHPEDRDRFITALSKEKRVSGYECELQSTTGEKRWVLVSAHIIIYDNQPAAFLIYNDISERKKMEILLQQSKKEVENILNAAADGIRIVGTDFTVKALNQTMAQLSGVNIKEGVGKYCKDMFGSDDVCGTEQCSLLQVLKTGKKFQREICRRMADGTKMYFLQVATPYRDGTGAIVGVIEDFRDITEIKNYDMKLKESEKKFRDLTELLPETIFEADLTGRVTYGNQKAFETFGYQPEELEKGLFIQNLIAPEYLQAFKENYGRILSGQSSNGNEYVFKKKDGTRFTALIYSSPVVKANEIVGVRGAAMDITELKRTQENLQQAYSKVKSLIEQKDDFINQLGHDLKTPLLPLINLLPLVRDTETNPKSKERLDVLIESVQYMKDLVLKTLSLAKLNSPALKLELKNIVLADEVTRILNKNKLLFEEHQITIENTIIGPLVINADPLRFEELLQNLLSNAVNYSPNGGTITLRASQLDRWITVSITDSGIGLAKKQLDNIFLEFYKVDEARHSLDSCGLGLTICKRIVEKHGGKIWAESQGQGKGSTFYFTLPSKD